MNIKEALEKLDPAIDSHWIDGKPNEETLAEFLGKPIHHSQQEMINSFSRPFISAEVGENSSQPKDETAIPIQAQIEEISATIQSKNQQVDRLKKELAVLSIECDSLHIEYEKSLPRKSSQQDIMDYLASENKAKEERFKNRQKLLNNLDPKDFPVQSPLDAAMATKKSRGSQRPARI